MLKQAINKAKLSGPQKHYINKLVRVDQAGELGADFIYAGQHFVFSRTQPALAPLIKEMWTQETRHRNSFNEIQTESRIRPSFFTPLWKTAAFGIGVSTALMGKEAAMACTEAVETVIGGHYNSQLRWLHQEFPKDLDDKTDIGRLKQTIKQFRDDELEHLQIAVENDSHKASPYLLLTEVIKGGCRGAIWVAERF